MPGQPIVIPSARVALVVVVLVAGVLMLGPFQGAERLFLLTDKEAHAAAFYTLTVLALLAAPRVRRNDIALTALALGAAAEIAQACVGRDGNIPDLLADAFGIALAWAPSQVQALRSRARSGAADRRRRRMGPAPSPAASVPSPSTGQSA